MKWLVGFFILWIIFEAISNSRKETRSDKHHSKKLSDDINHKKAEGIRPSADTLISNQTEFKNQIEIAKLAAETRLKNEIKINEILVKTRLTQDDFRNISTKINIIATPIITENKYISSFNKHGIISLWHITHKNNIAEILSKGILSNIQAYEKANPTDISNSNVQRWRKNIEPIYNRAIHDYAPLYINARNPMLYVKRNIQNELCLIEISLLVLSDKNFIYTDGNAASKNTNFFNDVENLSQVSWDVLHAAYWNDFPDGKRKRCAEVLIYPNIEPKYIAKIHCNSIDTLQYLKNMNCSAVITKNLFF